MAQYEEELSAEDLLAASLMLEQLLDGTFYQKQEEAAKEIGTTIKYIT